MPGGRPTKYKPDYVRQVSKLGEMFAIGITEEQLAEYFEVESTTIYRWKKAHPEFCNAIQKAKVGPDDQVERSLFERAIGYSHPEDRIFNNNGKIIYAPTTKHYPPDTAAAFIWLKNRRKEQWRDRHEVEHSGKIDIHVSADGFDRL